MYVMSPKQTKVGHGLGPSMGWVGSEFFLIFGGLGWVGLGGDLTE